MSGVLPPDPEYILKRDMGHIHSLSFPPNERNYTTQILAGTEKGTIYIWDLEIQRVTHEQEMGESLQAVHWFHDKIITQEKSGIVKLWGIPNMVKYETSHSYECYGGYCKSILLNDFLILPQKDSKLDIVNVVNMEKIRSLNPDREMLGNLMCLEKIELDGNTYILGGYETGDVVLWDFNASKVCGHAKLRDCITSITFDPITRRGVCSNSSNILEVFSIDKSLEISIKCELTITTEGCSIVKLRPDKKIFVAGGWDGRLRIFSWRTLRVLVVLTQHRGSLTDVQFSPKDVKFCESNIMAVSGSDGVISLWNIYN